MEGILKELTTALRNSWGLRILGFAQRLWSGSSEEGQESQGMSGR